MIKRIFVFLFIFVQTEFIFAMTPKPGSTSIGFSFLNPTGMNFKSWISENTGLNINFGVDPFDNFILFMNCDVQYHFDLIYNAPLATGLGIVMTVDSESRQRDNYNVGLHGLIGEEFFFKKAPLSFFIEGGGVFYFVPFNNLSLGWTGACGFRYYLTER